MAYYEKIGWVYMFNLKEFINNCVIKRKKSMFDDDLVRYSTKI